MRGGGCSKHVHCCSSLVAQFSPGEVAGSVNSALQLPGKNNVKCINEMDRRKKTRDNGWSSSCVMYEESN